MIVGPVSLTAVDADDLAFWEDSAGVRVHQPPDADDDWRLAHRWVWSRVRVEERIDASSSDAGRMFIPEDAGKRGRND